VLNEKYCRTPVKNRRFFVEKAEKDVEIVVQICKIHYI
jgi:hypothetical protein